MGEFWEELNEGSAEIDRQVGQMEDAGDGLTATISALVSVKDERVRQEMLRESGKFEATCADPTAMTDAERFAVLGEEFGEVAREVVEHGPEGSLRAELVQVAAGAVAWIEAIDATAEQGRL